MKKGTDRNEWKARCANGRRRCDCDGFLRKGIPGVCAVCGRAYIKGWKDGYRQRERELRAPKTKPIDLKTDEKD